jgi:hypothetical protein
MDTSAGTTQDRRQYPGLRVVFEHAYALSLPFLDPDKGIAGRALVHHVPVVLREHFPDLPAQELMVLVGALQGAFKARRMQTRLQTRH